MSDKDMVLPEGWIEVPLRDLCTPVNGRSFKSSEWSDSGLPIIRIQNLKSVDATFNYCDKDIDDKFHVSKGELLFAWSGTPGTSFGAHIWQGESALLNQHIFRVLFNRSLIQKTFFLHALNDKLDSFISQARGGVGLRHITKRKFEETQISLPPLAEQKRIVAKVETLLTSVGKVRTRLDRIPDILKRLRQSILAAAVFGKLTEDWRAENVSATDKEDSDLAVGWRSATIGEAINGLRYGTSKKCIPEKHGIPVLRIPNVVSGSVALDDLKYADFTLQELEKLRLQLGDILLIRSNGSISLVGRSALVQESAVGLAYAGYLIRLRPNSKVIVPEYLNFLLASEGCRSQIEKLARSSSGVNNINSEEVKSLMFLLPPLNEQHKIIDHLRQLFQFADKLETHYQKAKQAADKLTQSILAKALRGELVPIEAELARQEGRSYETAEELLVRIKAERAMQPKSKRVLRKPRKTMKKKAATRQAVIPIEQRLLDILAKAKGGKLTPEQLFTKSGYDEASVDEFYEGLRGCIDSKQITESRPGPKKVYLEAGTS